VKSLDIFYLALDVCPTRNRNVLPWIFPRINWRNLSTETCLSLEWSTNCGMQGIFFLVYSCKH